MSWTAYGTNVDVDAVLELAPSSPISGEPADQLEQAKRAAIALIDSGVVGDPDEYRFHVTLGGHANPGHEPQAGWAPDGISVNVSQATRLTAEQAEASAEKEEVSG